MWTNEKGSAEVVKRLRAFTPPYCPNPDCPLHQLGEKEVAWYKRYGSRSLLRFPYLVLKYRCKRCGRLFTSSFFTLSYRDKIRDTYEKIFDLSTGGFSHGQIARALGHSEETVRRRIAKLARWGLLRQAFDLKGVKIEEPVAFDGLENFAFSQYDPNNVNHVAGKTSHFTFDFNFSPLNRKGRMSPRQERRKKLLEEQFGPYPRDAIEKGSRRIFTRLLEKSKRLELHTDNHYAYRRALRSLKEKERILHCVTPAKATRNFRNRLFPINHLDMLTRHHKAAFKRETIAFSKHSIAMLESFTLLMIHKNYLRPKFLKPHKADPEAHTHSPAMKLKIAEKVFSFREFFKTRLTLRQVALSPDWQLFFQRVDPTSRRPIRPYLGI